MIDNKIIELIGISISRDELFAKADMQIQKLNATLMMLEIKGLVKEEAGKIVKI